MIDIEQKFLSELDAKLWKAADKLRSNLDAANYKHVVLGLIFLKYVLIVNANRVVLIKRDIMNKVSHRFNPHKTNGVSAKSPEGYVAC
jgi:hypothetical protein